MALDSFEYRDPYLVAITHERQYTCIACAKHIKTADRKGFRCAFNVEQYPDLTRDSCRYWVKRQRQPGNRY